MPGVPPKLTAVAPFRLPPVIVISAPLPAETEEKELIVDGGTYMKPSIDAVPPGLVTLTAPLAPPLTTAVI